MFDKTIARTPSSIGNLTVILTDENEDDETKTARFIVRVLDQNGVVMGAIDGNLVPHLTQAQVSALLSFMATLRAQAVSQILP